MTLVTSSKVILFLPQTGTLMITGTMLFSGCMYYRALTGEKKLQPYATVGGFCLMAAWLSLVL